MCSQQATRKTLGPLNRQEERESEQCNKQTSAPSPQSHAYYLPASSEPGTSTCSRTLSVGMEEALHTGQVMEIPS